MPAIWRYPVTPLQALSDSMTCDTSCTRNCRSHGSWCPTSWHEQQLGSAQDMARCSSAAAQPELMTHLRRHLPADVSTSPYAGSSLS